MSDETKIILDRLQNLSIDTRAFEHSKEEDAVMAQAVCNITKQNVLLGELLVALLEGLVDTQAAIDSTGHRIVREMREK